jgi:hypothetical protein
MRADDLTDAAEVSSWAEARERFAQIIGFKKEIPETVLRRAMFDSSFAHRLLVSRNSAEFLEVLINDPRNAAYAAPPAPIDAQPAPEISAEPAENGEPSNLALLSTAAKSLALWGATGFTHVKQEVYARRIAACQACPNLTAPPDKLAYRLAGGGKADRSICRLCGCFVRNKARMSTEACPAEHPDKPGYTRWDEVRKG